MHYRKDFDSIYLKYSDKIYKYVYLNTQDPYLSEDITSEVFLRIWKNWKKIRGDFMQALLYKTAKNILIDTYRKNKNKKRISLDEIIEKGIEPSYDEDLIEKINNDTNLGKINKAIQNLPDNLKDIVILRFINDLTTKEVADALNSTEVNIRVLQFRAIKKLKEILKNE